MRFMPTAAKLVAGISFACVGYFAAKTYLPGLPESYNAGYFVELNAALGFFVGWFVMGRQVGHDLRRAARFGFATSVSFAVWGILSFSVLEMVLRSLDKRYRMPQDALLNMVEIGWFFIATGLRLEFIVVMVLGGMLAGVLSEFADRIWN